MPKQLRIIVDSDNFSCDAIVPASKSVNFLKTVRKHFMRGKSEIKSVPPIPDPAYIDKSNLKVQIIPV